MPSESTAAATLGLINSIGQLGGFTGPYLAGSLNDRTHSLAASLALIALAYLVSRGLILGLRLHNPPPAEQGSNQPENDPSQRGQSPHSLSEASGTK